MILTGFLPVNDPKSLPSEDLRLYRSGRAAVVDSRLT